MWQFPPLGSDSFTIVRAELVEDPSDGSKYRDWDNATEIEVTEAKVNPFKLAEKLNYEATAGREFARTGLKFFAPAGTVVEETDRIIYRGETFTVFGHPQEWTDFDGVPSHVEFVCQIRSG